MILSLLTGPDTPVVDGVAVTGEEDQDSEGDDTDDSPLQFCNNNKTSASHLVIPHSVLTVVVQPVNGGLKAVVLDYHLLNAVVSTDDVFPPETYRISMTRSTLLITSPKF